MAENWRQRDECHPFEDTDGNICITVASAYETPGTDKDNRLEEAKRDGVDKLLRFYGKVPVLDTMSLDISSIFGSLQAGSTTEATEEKMAEAGGISPSIYDEATTPDYFVSYKPCVAMKVLVKLSKELFDSIPDDTSSCSITKPTEGYLEARLSIYDYAEKINFVVKSLETYLPVLARSSKCVSNVNVWAEIKRLKKTVAIIDRYMILNGIDKLQDLYNPCTDIDPSEGADVEVSAPYDQPDKKLIIGYTFDYKVAFALIDQEQHTIGYDCFIENTILNHLTTANFLVNLDSIHDFLKSSGTLDIFDFFLKFLLPAPIIKTKQKPSDGLPLYDENGVSFGWSDLAKLLSLEFDVNLCKTPEQVAEEDNKLLSAKNRKALRDSANQITKLKGDNLLSTEGVENLKDKTQNAGTGEDALTILYSDVMSKVNIACTVQEALQCYIDRTIDLVGEKLIDGDEELGQVLDLSVTLGALVDAQCGFKRCDGSLDIDFAIGFPIFQGIKIPENFPTLDYLAEIIAEAIDKLYAALVGALVSAILNILNNTCSLLFDDILGEGSLSASITSGFQDWASDSIGINYEDLSDPEAWGDALTSMGGTGFLGAIGNVVSLATDSAENITQFFSNLKSATQSVAAFLSPREQVSLYKGSASNETTRLAFKCLKLSNPDFAKLFGDEHQFADMFAELGKLVKPEFLQLPPEPEKVPPRNFCELGDGSEARLLREAILSEKDIDLSQDEINTIIDKEIEHNTEKIKNLAGILEKVLNGSFAPTFPSIFGGEDSLIPETPPVISEIAQAAAGGIFGAAINHFSLSSAEYPDLWDALGSGEGTEELFSPASDIYRFFDASSTTSAYEETSAGDDEIGNYNYGYIEASETGVEDGVQTSGAPGPQFAGGKENVFSFSIDENFKEENFKNKMLDEFGADGLVDLSPVYSQIMDFIEDWDDEGDELTNSIIFFDPANPLISYSIITYREGKWGSRRTDLYEVVVVQTIYDKDDQPEVSRISGDYGGVWTDRDTNNLTDRMIREFPETSGNSDLRKAISAYISDDMEEFAVIIAAAIAGGGVAMFSAPLAYAIGTVLATHGLISAAFFIALGPGALLLAAGAAIAVLIVALWKLFSSPPPRAMRLFVPADAENGDENGDVYSYDIIADYPEDGNWSVIKRKIPAELVLGTGGGKPDTWPSKLVTLQKDPGMQITTIADMTKVLPGGLFVQDRTIVSEYNQAYSISTAVDRFGLRDTSQGLSLTNYNYSNDDYGYQKQLFEGIKKYSYAARDFGDLVASSLGDYFTNDSDKDIIDQIATEVKERYSGGDPAVNLPNLLLIQLGRHILSNRYWQSSSLKNKTLSYPSTDIFDYADLNADLQEFVTTILPLQWGSEYCDNLSANRRANVTYATIMLIRAYIIEQAMISIQVLDSIDSLIITDDLFVEHVYNLIQKETDLYRNSFDIENRIFTDLVDNVIIYYEIRQILGEDVPTFDISKDYLKQLIREQSELLAPQIGDTMNLTNAASSWERFLATKLFGDFDATINTTSTMGVPSTVASGVGELDAGATGGFGVDYYLEVVGTVQDSNFNVSLDDESGDWALTDPNYTGPFELYGDNWTGQALEIDPNQQGLSSEGASITVPENSQGTNRDGLPYGLSAWFSNIPDELVADINSMWDEWMVTHVPVSAPGFGGYDANALLSRGDPEPTYVNLNDIANTGWLRTSVLEGTLTKRIGVEDWTVAYHFTIDGNMYNHEIVVRNNIRQVSQPHNDYTKYIINLRISSQVATDLPSIQADSILTPFQPYGEMTYVIGEAHEGREDFGLVQGSPEVTEMLETRGSTGFIFERYIKAKQQDDDEYEIFGPQAFFDYIGGLDSDNYIFDKYDYIKFGHRLVYVTDNSALNTTTEDQTIRDLFLQLDPDDHRRSQQNKAFIMTDQSKVVNGNMMSIGESKQVCHAVNSNGECYEYGEEITDIGEMAPVYDYIAIPLVSFECKYDSEAADITTVFAEIGEKLQPGPTFSEFLTEMDSRYESEIYLDLRTELLATDEFKRIFDLLVPIQEMCIGFMMYQYNALSDEDVFPANMEDSNIYTIMSNTKLTILQIFESALYGAGKVIYNDPFTQKAGSELV